MVESRIRIEDLNVWYQGQRSLRGISAAIPATGITAIIGPSGCGKTTLLKCLNRLLEETEGAQVQGKVFLDGINLYDSSVDVIDVRARIGLLAPKPFPLPMSIYDNVAYGPRIHGEHDKHVLDRIVEEQLKVAGLWQEVQHRLQAPASGLSTGQQQRLCLARALAVEPEVLLCDEPTSALDPHAAQRIETQLQQLKGRMTIVVVTHILRQARRLADFVLFLWMGELVESGPVDQVFHAPQDARTRSYLEGQFG